jgi:hypothetical protein
MGSSVLVLCCAVQGGCTGLCFAPGSTAVVFTSGKDGRVAGVDLRKQQVSHAAGGVSAWP